MHRGCGRRPRSALIEKTNQMRSSGYSFIEIRYLFFEQPSATLLEHGGIRYGSGGARQVGLCAVYSTLVARMDSLSAISIKVNMTNQQKLLDVFSGSLGIAAETITDDLKYNSIPEWDSIGHMSLITGVETEFDIMLDTSDIIDMSSVRIAKEILARYGVTFEE
jgi:acyl carrier protein